MNKHLFKFAAVITISVTAQVASAADAPKLNFVSVNSPQDVFKAKVAGEAGFTYSYMPYLEWTDKQSGKTFPMDVAPVLTGKNAGGVSLPAPQMVDEGAYSKQKQAKEFVRVVNGRNAKGRPELKLDGAPAKLLENALKNTHVIQTVMSGVVNRPFSQLRLSPEKLAELVKSVDADHFHFPIPGSLALSALEKDHAAARQINEKQAYLLSVFDFRDYGCPALKNGLRDHFAQPGKEPLMNESLYVVSDLRMNEAADLDGAQKFFGKKPDAILSQAVIYADHLIRGGRTMFMFFSEGDKTRVVLLSNIAMKSEYFVGKTSGALKRQLILDGPRGAFGGVTGAALDAKDALKSAAGSAVELITGATKDVSEKNTCDRGLGLGMIRYSQSLFSEFENYLLKP